jgi:transglutaminase-like putative cysteine protease
MRWPSRSFVVAVLAFATGAVVTRVPADERADPWTSVARYELAYRVRLRELAPTGDDVSLWVPYPAETRDQRVVDAHVDSPWPERLTREEKYGNRMVYLEGKPDGAVGDLVMRFVVERRPSMGTPARGTADDAYLRPALYQMPDKLIPLSGVIRNIAEREGRGSETRTAKIRAFYDYVYRTMSYDKSGTGWGRGDAVWACENKRGNCTDFHSLFIGMLRSQGIPARFLIGFPIPDADEGTIPGYHCWAEFYDEQRGWLPIDASEAKKRGMADAYFGTIPNDRVEFTAGRDIVLSPPQHGEPLNYFVYPYAEAEGRPVAPPSTEIRFRRLAPHETPQADQAAK